MSATPPLATAASPERCATPYCRDLPFQGEMLGPARVFAAPGAVGPETLAQIAQVAALPGLAGAVCALPEVQPGYGFPVGVVAAFDPRAGGVVVPGGIGYDINCGVRLLRSELDVSQLRPRLSELLDDLLREAFLSPLRLSRPEVAAVLTHGAGWAVARGWGMPADVECVEWRGTMPHADPQRVSERALARGTAQLGTVGSGGHFIEIGCIDAIHDARAAEALALAEGQVTVLIHSGSRGLGCQVCADGVELMLHAAERYRIHLPDRQLACAPLASEEGRHFLAAMAAAANYGFANRQVLTHRVRESMARALGRPGDALGLAVACDAPHNLASCETHVVADRPLNLCVHRRGAARCLPPGHPDLPPACRATGRPAVLPAALGRCSLVLLPDAGVKETFNSLPHGAGRRLGRAAVRRGRGEHECAQELAADGIEVRTASPATLEECAAEAYGGLEPVLGVLTGAGLARPVARLRPLGVLRG